jgi:hypothetical protein
MTLSGSIDLPFALLNLVISEAFVGNDGLGLQG